MPSILIKIGGSILEENDPRGELGKGISGLLKAGYDIVIVHGGGKSIKKELDRINKESVFIDGMRVTDSETIRIVQNVLSGEVNKKVVTLLFSEGLNAVGISGIDGGLLQAVKMDINGKDPGFVGSVKNVDTKVIKALHSCSFIPVISPVSLGCDGCIYNVNADVAASEIATALACEHLVFLSDVEGVKIEDKTADRIRINEIENLIEKNIVKDGMVPKLRSAASCINRGTGKVHICSSIENIAQQLKTGRSPGTLIY